ncbi:hypothetical protein ABH995_006814 [Bradyrhizobium yuanmingense]
MKSEQLPPDSLARAWPAYKALASIGRRWMTKDALDRLTPFGWRGGLAFILAFSFLSFLLCGYYVVYWRNADMDFMVIYSALALNDGASRSFFDHPAYLSILSVQTWFRLLHELHLLDAWTLSAIPSPSDRSAFDAAMTSAVRAGRILAVLTASALVLCFATLARRIISDNRIAACAAFAFAISGGVQMHMRTLRSEMIAGCFCILALMILIIVARRGMVWRPLGLAAAASLCVLGLENKVHAILLVGALPALALPFGTTSSASAPFWRSGSTAWPAAAIAALAAAGGLALSWPLISKGFDPAVASAAGLKPLLLGTFGVYQIVLLGWIYGCMISFAKLWQVSIPETVASMCAVAAGASLSLLALHIQYAPEDPVIVLNPLEKMMVYVDLPDAAGSPLGAFGLLLSGLIGVLRRYTFILYSSPRPAVFLTWLVIPGIVYAWRYGEKQVTYQAGLLLLAAIAIDSLGVRRGLKVEYFVFTDPLIILAGMLLLDRMRHLRFQRLAFPIGAALIVAHILISQAEPVKIALKLSGPENICDWRHTYMPRLQLPFCSNTSERTGSNFGFAAIQVSGPAVTAR